jgi:hypothetical protein
MGEGDEDKENASEKSDDFPASIGDYKDYLGEETTLVFANPQLQFTIQSNLGVPLVFSIKELSSKMKNDAEERSFKNKEYILNLAEIDAKNDTIFSLNRNSFSDPEESKDYSEMFSTDLDSLKLRYTVATKAIDIDHLDQAGPIQHLSSNSYIEIAASAVLPMTLGVGTQLAYSETVEVSYTEDIEFTGSLFIYYKNTLPLEMHITLTLLDENDEGIATWKLYMEKREVGNDDEWLQLLNDGKELQIDTKDLKATKNIRIEYTSGELKEEVSLRKDQKLSLKLAAGISGSINVNLNDTEEK